MIHVVLVEPEIPPNTGNIARTCAATGVSLHLVEPLGFSLDDRYLKRAGLDYWKDLNLHIHRDITALFAHMDSLGEPVLPPALLTTRGEMMYTDIVPPVRQEELFLLFGPETRGLSDGLLADHPGRRYRIPMLPHRRSLNLSNSVAIVVYGLLQKQNFPEMI